MPETTISIMGCLREISGRLTDAAAIAKAAVTCAESGSEHQAVRIVLELDEMLHEANTLLNGARSSTACGATEPPSRSPKPASSSDRRHSFECWRPRGSRAARGCECPKRADQEIVRLLHERALAS